MTSVIVESESREDVQLAAPQMDIHSCRTWYYIADQTRPDETSILQTTDSIAYLISTHSNYSNPLPCALVAGIPTPGTFLTPPSPGVLILTSSTFPFANVIAGITHDPQLHLIPCHAYLPTLDLHFGHSRRPSTFPCSSSGRIQESGSRKRWAQVRASGKGLLWGSWGCGIRNWDFARGRLCFSLISMEMN